MTGAPAQSPLLEVRDLEVSYDRRGGHSERAAVAGVSFEVVRGECLGLVGESGSGKSSIARALLRLVRSRGEVRLDGVDLLRARGVTLRALRAQMQIVFQDPLGALDPRMNVLQLVTEPLLEFGRGSRRSRRDRALPLRPCHGAVPRPRHGNRAARRDLRHAQASVHARLAGGEPSTRSDTAAAAVPGADCGRLRRRDQRLRVP